MAASAHSQGLISAGSLRTSDDWTKPSPHAYQLGCWFTRKNTLGQRCKRYDPLDRPTFAFILLTPAWPTEQKAGSRRTSGMRPVGTAEELQRRRIRAVELVQQGESP